MFVTTSRWGFPYKIARIISRYEGGQMSLTEALENIGKIYGSDVKQYFTYDGNGKKIAHTCIEFGRPIVASYVF